VVLALGGEIRSVSPSGFVRAVRMVTGIEVLATCLRWLSHLVLRTQRRGEVRLDGGVLHIREERSIFGRALPERLTVVPVEQVVSISVFERRAELLQTVGWGALAAGTLLGTGLVVSGLRVAGFAPSLLAGGLLLAALGAIVDLALDRAAQRTPERRRSPLPIAPARGPSILLSDLPPESALSWLESTRDTVAASAHAASAS